jgi:hypothetical protein
MSEKSTIDVDIATLDGTVTPLEIQRIQFFWKKRMIEHDQITDVTQIVYRTDEPYVVKEDNGPISLPDNLLSFSDILFPAYHPKKRVIVTGRAVVETNTLLDDIWRSIRAADNEQKAYVFHRAFAPNDPRVYLLAKSDIGQAIRNAYTDGGGRHEQIFSLIQRYNGGGGTTDKVGLLWYLPTYDGFGIQLLAGTINVEAGIIAERQFHDEQA